MTTTTAMTPTTAMSTAMTPTTAMNTAMTTSADDYYDSDDSYDCDEYCCDSYDCDEYCYAMTTTTPMNTAGDVMQYQPYFLVLIECCNQSSSCTTRCLASPTSSPTSSSSSNTTGLSGPLYQGWGCFSNNDIQ